MKWPGHDRAAEKELIMKTSLFFIVTTLLQEHIQAQGDDNPALSLEVETNSDSVAENRRRGVEARYFV